eukprot:scaffold60460_cov33-Tisochrysis_lutea.AAC.1
MSFLGAVASLARGRVAQRAASNGSCDAGVNCAEGARGTGARQPTLFVMFVRRYVYICPVVWNQLLPWREYDAWCNGD